MKNLGSSIYHGREHEEEEDSKVEATQAHWGASKLVESLESIDVDGLSMQGSISREVSLGALEWWKPPQSGLYNYVL